MNTEKRKALIVGATGLVGNELLYILLQSNTYEKVKALVRKPISIKHSKLIQRLVDFDALEKYEEKILKLVNITKNIIHFIYQKIGENTPTSRNVKGDSPMSRWGAAC